MEFVDHAADFGMEVRAPTLEACFARAAAGVFASFVPHSPWGGGQAARTVEVRLEEAGLEQLLVAWLEELLYESEVTGLLFFDFEVDQIAEEVMIGRATGRRPAAGEEPAGPAVKAVTWHGLELVQENGAWRARVFLDV